MLYTPLAQSLMHFVFLKQNFQYDLNSPCYLHLPFQVQTFNNLREMKDT